MQKAKLRALKRLNATPTMVRIARNNILSKPITHKNRWGSEYKYDRQYDLMLRCQTRGSILMIAIFIPENIAQGSLTPTYEIYCNPEGNEFITRVRKANGEEEKWSDAMLFNLPLVQSRFINRSCGVDDYFKNSRIWQNQGGKAEIKQFLDVDFSGYRGIQQFQNRCREEKIKAAEAREQKPWDDVLALTPPIIPSFKHWSLHEAADEHFIFYRSIHDKTGYCSYCEKEVPMKDATRNGKGKCPKCRKWVTFKLRSKIQELRTRRRATECIQKIDGGFVIRQFQVCSAYRGRTYDNPDWTFHEEERYFYFEDGTVEHYTWDNYKNKKMRFVKSNYEYIHTMWNLRPKLYRKNLAALKKSALKHSSIDLWPELPCGAPRYMHYEQGNPAIEMLAKIGMFKLAEDMMNKPYEYKLLNESATELAKMLKIDNARLRRLKGMQGRLMHLKWLQLEKQANTIWPDAMIKDLGDADVEMRMFGFLPSPIKIVKAYNYIKRQQALSDDNLYQVITTWRDYYNLAEQNKWNIASSQIAMPKDLGLSHTNAILFSRGESIKAQSAKLIKKWPKVDEILPKIKKFEFSNDEYAVVAPKNIEDMVREGIALNHCMDHADFYYDRIQKYEAYPFFLRKKEQIETPWYTLEVEASGNIRQKRTTGDNQNPDLEPAIPFLQEFMKHYKSVMDEIDKEQGEAAVKARIEEYKELRKNGNRIWRGKLAGKLLVDVLEADFMEVK